MYFTPESDYEGGGLVVGDERLRPTRGDVVLIRSDVEHEVEPLTAGSRTTLTVAAAERRWWLDPDVFQRADRDDRCRMVDQLFTDGELDLAVGRQALAVAWTACLYPEDTVPTANWVAMFKAAGFLADHAGNRAPTEALEVFRACDAGRERRMTWTTSRDGARWFADHYDRAEVWRAVIPPDDVLAIFNCGSAVEVVVDPSQLDELELVEECR